MKLYEHLIEAEADLEKDDNKIVAHFGDHDAVFRRNLLMTSRAMEVKARMASRAIRTHQGPMSELDKKLRDLGFTHVPHQDHISATLSHKEPMK